MTNQEIIDEINSIFEEQFEIDPAELTPEKKIFDDLGLDSLDIVDLMVGLQRKFGIPLRQHEKLRQIVTLNDVYQFFIELAAEHPEFAANLHRK